MSNGTGRRTEGRRKIPGFCVEFNDYYPDGRRVHRRRTFSKRAQALAFRNEINTRRDTDGTGQIVAVHLDTASTEFLEGCSALHKQTLIQYSAALLMLRQIVGDKPVSEIRGIDLDRFVARRLRAKVGSGKDKRLCQPATVLRHLRSLRRFFNWAIDRNYIKRNPVKSITSKPKSKNVRKRPILTSEHIEKLLKAIDGRKTPDGPDDPQVAANRRLGVLIAMTTGLDRSLITHLCPSQINLAQQRIVLDREKTNKELNLHLHRDLVAQLAPRLQDSAEHQPMFLNLRRRSGDDWWRRARRAAGCPTLWFRDLRAYASMWLQEQAGLPLSRASEVLGHSSVATTQKHYRMPDPQLALKIDATPLPGCPAPRPEKTETP